MKIQSIILASLAFVAVSCNSGTEKTENTAKAEDFENASRFLENEKFNSRIGELEFKNGFPTPATTETLFDFRTYYRTIEVINQNVFAASLARMRRGTEEVGAGKPNEVLVWQNLMDAASELLTANSQTVYGITFLDLKTDGPTVIVAPPSMLGLLDDMWMGYVGDIGALGPDKGAGGKYLVIPPGYEGEIPEGYFILHSKTYGVWLLLRSGLVDGKTDVANELYSQLEVYPLSEKDNPEPTKIIEASGMDVKTIHDENYALIEEIADLVEREHPNAISSEQKFLLAAIGIEFGKPFTPSAKDKKIMLEAARVGGAMLRTNMWNYTGEDKWIYGKWWTPFVGGKHTFDGEGYFNYDAQAFFGAVGTGITPAMVVQHIGLGSQYLATHTDNTGTPFDGAKSYKLHVPANVPVKDFWSVLIYDAASRSMLKQSQPFPAIDSYSDLNKNEDGSIDLYFGPIAPEGKESNWIETVPNKGFLVEIRLYGPLEAYFDRTWKMSDVERID